MKKIFLVTLIVFGSIMTGGVVALNNQDLRDLSVLRVDVDSSLDNEEQDDSIKDDTGMDNNGMDNGHSTDIIAEPDDSNEDIITQPDDSNMDESDEIEDSNYNPQDDTA